MIQQSHLWVYIQKQMKSRSQRYMNTSMFVAALSAIATYGNNLCVRRSANGWRECGINTVEYYAGFFKKKEILLCDEPEKHAKWNKLDRERQISLGIFYKQSLQKKLKS